MRTLAIIPARAGSKGVPSKNIRALAGRPLIEWSIRQALASSAITDTVVSTDDEAIAEVAREAGAIVPFRRPAELATDEAPTEPVMLHALEQMERENGRYDAVVLLQPTSPFRHADTIDAAMAQLWREGHTSLLGVVESHAFFWQNEPNVIALYDFAKRPRRQDIPNADKRYRETGSLYISRRDAFLTSSNRISGDIGLFMMKEEEGWEIDTPFDFLLLEQVFKVFST